MRQETRALLDLVRDAEGPSAADEQRVLDKLQSAIAAGLGPSVGPMGISSLPGSTSQTGDMHAGDANFGAQYASGHEPGALDVDSALKLSDAARVGVEQGAGPFATSSFGQWFAHHIVASGVVSKLSVLALCSTAAVGVSDTPTASLDGGVDAVPSLNTAALAASEHRPSELPVREQKRSTEAADSSLQGTEPEAASVGVESSARPPVGTVTELPATNRATRLLHYETTAARRAPPVEDTRSSRDVPVGKPHRRPPALSVPAPVELASEVRLLTAVQASLRRGDGAAALKALDAHKTQDRQFTAERSALRVLALCALGDSQRAAHSARKFLRDHPDSIHRTAVSKACSKLAVP